MAKLTGEDLKEIGVVPVGHCNEPREAIAGLVAPSQAATPTTPAPPLRRLSGNAYLAQKL
jgi:hypothetical protein